MRNHTGTHLLHRALRNVVGERARQAGSLVTPDYLRFDFPFDRALTDDEKRAIEDEVRRIIRDDRPVSIAFMTMAEAIEGGADAFFDEKYGETVRTIRVEDYSFELCGGTHCRATGQIGGFVITGERSIGSRDAPHRGASPAPPPTRSSASGSTTLERAADGRSARRRSTPSPERVAALQDELREAKRRLKAGGGGRPARSPASWPRRAREVAPGVRLVAAAAAVRLDGRAQGAARDVRGALGLGRRRARPRRRRAAAVRDRHRRPRRARHLGRRPGHGRDARHRGPRRRTAGDGPGQGHAPRRARPTRWRRSGPASRHGGLMAFWRRIWQRDGERGARRLHRARRRHRVRQGARLRDRRRRATARSAASAASARACRTCSRARSPTSPAVVDNCAVALQEAEEMAGFRPTQVVIGIAGELVKGFTTTHSQERKKPDQPITEAELQKLIDAVQREALHEAERAITWETGLPHVDVRLVHAAVTGASIDGYALTNPVGFQGRHVKIGIFNAFAPLVHLGALQSVASQLDLELLEIVAEPYAVARVLGSDQIRQAGALFVDVGGGTTDVALVRQGGIEGTRMFALGGRAFTKSLADRLDLPFPRAEALKVDYARGRRGRAARRTSPRSSPTTSRVWAAGVELVMEELSGGDLLPGRIFLCGGGSRLPEIRRRPRRRRRSTSGCRSPGRPRSSVMAPDQIETISDATDLLVDQQDVTPLGLAYQAIELQTTEDAARCRPAPRPAGDEGLTDGRTRSSTSTSTTRSPRPPPASAPSEAARVAVVLPYGSRVATSRINFRLLSRDALTHEKRLSIVAGDPATRALAASAGLPVFASVAEYEASVAGLEDDRREPRPRRRGRRRGGGRGAAAARLGRSRGAEPRRPRRPAAAGRRGAPPARAPGDGTLGPASRRRPSRAARGVAPRRRRDRPRPPSRRRRTIAGAAIRRRAAPHGAPDRPRRASARRSVGRGGIRTPLDHRRRDPRPGGPRRWGRRLPAPAVGDDRRHAPDRSRSGRSS